MSTYNRDQHDVTDCAMSVRDQLVSIHPYLGWVERDSESEFRVEDGWWLLDHLLDAPSEGLASMVEARCAYEASRRDGQSLDQRTLRRAAISILFQSWAWRAFGPIVARRFLADGQTFPSGPVWMKWTSELSLEVGRLRADEPGLGSDAHAEFRAETERRGPNATANIDQPIDRFVDLAAGWAHHLAPLSEAFRSFERLGPRQCPGNAASPLASMVRLLGAHGHIDLDEVPELWRSLAIEVSLESYGSWSKVDVDGQLCPWFKRSTCCLMFTVAAGDMCGDCSRRSPMETATVGRDWWSAQNKNEN